jgi:hypothetical protein
MEALTSRELEVLLLLAKGYTTVSIASMFIVQNEVFIDISAQPAGMYLIKLQLENQVIVKEIVKE